MAENIFSAPPTRYFSIPSGCSFLKDLAGGLTASFRAAGFDAPDATIYLPTRRAARALSEAFLAASGASAALTPHIKALGDIDEDTLDIEEGDIGGLEDELALAPAISCGARRLILARFVAEKEKVWFDGQRRWAGAIAAADELGKLLDSLYTEEINPSALAGLAPEHLAQHWRDSLEFLEIVTEAWPAHLRELGLADPSARRIALIDAQTKRWARTPPQKPVIIAGTTGSTPAVARMMKLVAGAPFGAVVLPGLDLEAPEEVWDAVDEPHPQSGLKALLEALEITRANVTAFPSPDAGRRGRANLITVALRPAGASDSWRGWADAARAAGPQTQTAIDGLSLVEARDEEREASIIALKFRETLETPDKTAMLVTPDRDLARRVAIKMRRWGVVVDDSAGAPFANTPCGNFLRLVAEWLPDISDPVRLMALIDHPLFGGGLATEDRTAAVRWIDKNLRGLRPRPGIDGLRRTLGEEREIGDRVERILQTLDAAGKLWSRAAASFVARFDAHVQAAEVLAASAGESGAARLWRGDDGDAGAALLAQLRDGLSLIVHDRAGEYADIFTRLIAGGAVRRRAPAHPRLSILGPLEARLQFADLVILAGLNEGVWPRDAAVDPFLSRGMRKNLGLPSPERRIGLAAHDFAQLAAAPEVVLTRSCRIGGKPSKPSRWIVRLKNILRGADIEKDVDISAISEALAALLDKPEPVAAITAPQPRPPLSARPDQLSVTRIETLMRDPYSIYARYVLGLRKWDPLGEDFDIRQVGNLFHKVFEEYAEAPTPASLGEKLDRLETIFDAHAPNYGFEPRHEPFWRARAREAFGAFVTWDDARRTVGAPVVLEKTGKHTFDVNGRPFTLTAKADRIDALKAGGAFIVDYKTGALPTLKQMPKFSPQLPLTGMIVEAGGFEDCAATAVGGFEYVRFIGGDGKPTGADGADASSLIAETREGLTNVLRHFNNPASAYPSQPRPQYENRFGDYDHLARRRERGAQGSDDGGGDA